MEYYLNLTVILVYLGILAIIVVPWLVTNNSRRYPRAAAEVSYITVLIVLEVAPGLVPGARILGRFQR